MGLELDLQEDYEAPPSYYLINKQSPASGVPPDSGERLGTRGDYTPLNPDIEKPTPPRYGSLKRVRDPFTVTDRESPPVLTDQLSPNHVFDSPDRLFGDPADRRDAIAGDRESTGEPSDCSDHAAADDGSSVCSADSAELGVVDDLPLPPLDLDDISPSGTYSKVRKPRKCDDVYSGASGGGDAPDLDDIAIGSLDYDQLMNYFQSLRESAA